MEATKIRRLLAGVFDPLFFKKNKNANENDLRTDMEATKIRRLMAGVFNPVLGKKNSKQNWVYLRTTRKAINIRLTILDLCIVKAMTKLNMWELNLGLSVQKWIEVKWPQNKKQKTKNKKQMLQRKEWNLLVFVLLGANQEIF